MANPKCKIEFLHETFYSFYKTAYFLVNFILQKNVFNLYDIYACYEFIHKFVKFISYDGKRLKVLSQMQDNCRTSGALSLDYTNIKLKF